ncbi:hypothetical protein P153DRAFT_360026 [Dothidotthia symphoricarpi CBS 119687]|uniref:Uncharacterized protein n=1 Tax=Dothidotthia symphoricarpi CBS 119687 TaxID=1392245 RepID=A0A6A6A3C9_9PLEO|nr:uncharacterized protein P153DRAFT_360026 [Dothidotthia symphoricarpi CBS 119687]KAF2125685.1 hypothetical protein P153DRAFT_360026 [Dothidotthia symphoricarpi CBS 119687]
MSSQLQRSYSIPMRPISDKEMEFINLDQLFEEYVDIDSLQHFSNSTPDRLNNDEVAHLFSVPSSNGSGSFSTSLRLNQHVEAAWQQALQRCEQNSALYPNSSNLYFNKRGKESSSEFESIGIEDRFEPERNQSRSISLPPIPRPHTSRSIKKATSFIDRPASRGTQKVSKMSSNPTFPNMMQPSYCQSSMPEVRARKIETPTDSFSLYTSPDNTCSNPSITRSEPLNRFSIQNSQPYITTRSSGLDYKATVPEASFSNSHLTPETSPAMIPVGFTDNSNSYVSNMNLSFNSSTSNAAHSALQTPPSFFQVPVPTWASNTPPELEYLYPASPEQSSTKLSEWWEDDTIQSANKNASFSHTSMTGLGITCGSASFSDLSTEVIVGEEATASSFDMGYTTMYPTPPLQLHNQDQHGIPTSHRSSRSCSPRRRRTSSRSHRAHRSQSSSCQSPGNGGFVNFTPDDSRKILTGVAPSGSSKTKARREKEAVEKRKKLSQVAMKAIMEAGGDVNSLRTLEREALFGLES